MSKFGELVQSNIPVLIDFYADWDKPQSDQATATLRNVAVALGDKAKVIKIDVEKNEVLAQALRIKVNPTYIIYKDSEMKWRQSGEQDADTLINLVQQFV